MERALISSAAGGRGGGLTEEQRLISAGPRLVLKHELDQHNRSRSKTRSDEEEGHRLRENRHEAGNTRAHQIITDYGCLV